MKKENENGGKDPGRDAIEKLSGILHQFGETYGKAAHDLYDRAPGDEEGGRRRVMAAAAEVLVKYLEEDLHAGNCVFLRYDDEPDEAEVLFADGRSGIVATLLDDGILQLFLEPDYAGVSATVQRMKEKAEAEKGEEDA